MTRAQRIGQCNTLAALSAFRRIAASRRLRRVLPMLVEATEWRYRYLEGRVA